jgi:transposase
MKMDLSAQQRRELRALARHGEPGYLRVKALALLNLAGGQSVSAVARLLWVSRQSVYAWRRRYHTDGVAGLRVAPGRGRKGTADRREIEHYLRRSPRQFGLHQTRWSLTALARVVPSLQGFSAFGVQKALRRAGYRYKRGQPHLHSPDPAYAEKKGRWTKP